MDDPQILAKVPSQTPTGRDLAAVTTAVHHSAVLPEPALRRDYLFLPKACGSGIAE